MRRWFIALFALHFLVSVNLFTVVHFGTDGEHGAVADAPLAENDMPRQFLNLMGQLTADSDPTDSSPDLPEALRSPRTRIATGIAPETRHSATVPKPTKPALPGPQRPPRAPFLA